MAWEKHEEQPKAREGAKFTPKHPEAATTKAKLDKIRGQQSFDDVQRGPSHHTGNPSG